MRAVFFDRMMAITDAIAAGSTCQAAAVGCLLIDRNKSIIGTGYNGVPKGFQHCTEEVNCKQAGLYNWNEESCLATHAEINALMHCKDVHAVHWVFCTKLPCYRCMKALLNSSMEVLVYKEKHADTEAIKALIDERAKQGRSIILVTVNKEGVYETKTT